MIIEVDESFKKDFKNIKDKIIQKRVIEKLNIIEKSKTLEDITNIKKLKWFDKYFRLRIWDYRIGFSYDWIKIVLIRVRSRKDIYNIFP